MPERAPRRLRVALVANSFDPVFGERAGGHVHLMQVAKRWKDFDLVVFAPEDARDSVTRALPDARFVASPSCATANRALLFMCRAILSVVIVPELRRCDAILCLSQFLPDAVPAALARPRSATVVLWHLMEPPGKRQGSYLNNMLAYAAEQLGRFIVERSFPALIVGSELLARQMRLPGRKRYFVTTNGVEHLPLTTATVAGNRSGALFVGRLHPSKGIEELIEAWKIVAQDVPDVILTIAGSGAAEYERHVRASIAQSGLEGRVRILGAVTESQKFELLRNAAAFAFPSREEGWGIALAEAMACGVPCVTYDLPIFDEIFPAGRLAAHEGDTVALAANIRAVLSDSNLAERLSRDALRQARDFSWDRAASVEAEALKSIAADT